MMGNLWPPKLLKTIVVALYSNEQVQNDTKNFNEPVLRRLYSMKSSVCEALGVGGTIMRVGVLLCSYTE